MGICLQRDVRRGRGGVEGGLTRHDGIACT